MTVLVTGGPGYLGSRLIREIPDHPAFSGEEIRIFDNLRQPRFHALWDLPVYAEYDFVEGDVREEADVREAMAGVDTVFHLAAITNTVETVSRKNGTHAMIVLPDGDRAKCPYYHRVTMEYANVSVKFPRELDEEIERFLEETGIYTNKSEFIKEACRRHLQDLQDDSAIAALRVEQLLERAEGRTESDAAIREQLTELRANVDTEGADLASVVEASRKETADRTFEDA